MSALVWAGAAVAGLGILALGWCIREAARLRSAKTGPDEVQRRLRVLVAVNGGALAFAFLGLGLMVTGAIL